MNNSGTDSQDRARDQLHVRLPTHPVEHSSPCPAPALSRLSATTVLTMVVTPPRKLSGSPISRIPVPGALPQDDDKAPVKVRRGLELS